MSDEEYQAIYEAIEDLGEINNDCHEKIKLLKMVLLSQGEICSLIVSFFRQVMDDLVDKHSVELFSLPSVKDVLSDNGIEKFLE